LCAYWPVSTVARDGQQSEKLTKLLSKVTPWSASSRFTFGMNFSDACVWSSVSIRTMFSGLGAVGAAETRSAAPPTTTASAAATTSVTAPLMAWNPSERM